MIRKLVAALLLVVLPLHLGACAHAPAYRLEPHAFPGTSQDTLALRRLAGESVRLQLHSGGTIRLDSVRVQGDTVIGSGISGAPAAIVVSLDSIAGLTIRHPDRGANFARGVANAYTGTMIVLAIGGVVVTIACLKLLREVGQEGGVRVRGGR